MTDNTQPEALRLAEMLEQEARLLLKPRSAAAAAELRRQHVLLDEQQRTIAALNSCIGRETTTENLTVVGRLEARIAELEAQLESIGAGGVSGPLIGQPQAMPDLSQLTERGAKAWAGVDAQGLREGFTAADMATAAAQGFRDGVASLAANAGEPPIINGQLYTALGNLFSHLGAEGCVTSDHAFVWDAMTALKRIDGGVHLDDLAVPVDPDAHRDDMLKAVQLLEDGEWAEHFAKTPIGMRLEDQITKLHSELNDAVSAAPPTAQAEGWRLVPVEPTQEMIDAMRSRVWLPASYRAMLAAPPTTPAGSGKGE